MDKCYATDCARNGNHLFELAVGFALPAPITLRGVDLIRRWLALRGDDRKPLETSSD